MNSTRCEHCGATHEWTWEEAFDKFGFDDGDGMVMTDTIVTALEAAGFTVKAGPWGMHNVIITSIKRKGRELIPAKAKVGYADPRKYLPKAVIKVLDAAFAPHSEEVAPWL
jgi:hypothetical protein